MRRHILSAVFLALAFGAGVLAPAIVDADSAKPYIVILKSGTNATATAGDHENRRGADVDDVYTHTVKGYSAKIPPSRLAAIRADSRVAYVEPDGIARITAQTLPWGINKIDADISSTKAGNGSGSISNVNAYIIDTGVVQHSDINLVRHVNFVAGSSNTDCNGHGTHVAGTVAARDNSSYVVGAGPGAPVTGVKVLACNGSGAWSDIIRGIDWVTANAKKPAVANLSLVGSPSQALDDAVRRSATSGITYAIAAGNSGRDACSYSPARAGVGNNGIVTVAATDSSDREASWSNYGSCVDIWAPGVNVISTSRTGGTSTMSGTSMASPHVGGGAALYLSRFPSSTPTSVETAIKSAGRLTGTVSKNGVAIRREYVGGF